MNIRKITALAGSLLMTGLTVTTAAAAAFPAPFVQNGVGDVAIVYGASSLDQGAATNVQTALSTYATKGSISVGDVSLSEDEVVLGGSITATGSKILASIEDNKLSGLRDEKISWDDGDSSKDYNIHEEIIITNMGIITSLKDEDLGGVALTNEKGLAYRLVFDDALNLSGFDNNDADTLYLEILGHEYEIEDMTNTSIKVTTSEEVALSIGDTYNVAGKTVTIVDIFEGSVEVSVEGKSEVITATNSKKIEGVRVNVKTVGYHSNAPETSRAVLNIGEDLSKTYEDGDEYIGEDEDEPLWVWDISGLETDGGYIGVIYNVNINDASDEYAGDSIKYVGEGYILPDNYAAVTLDSITDVDYQDLKFYFEDGADLYSNNDTTDAVTEDQHVLVIEAENEDSITVNGVETDTMYLYFNVTAGAFEAYAKDVDGDYTPTNRFRLADTSTVLTNDDLTEESIATMEIGDTDLDIKVSVTDGIAYVNVTNDGLASSYVTLTLGSPVLLNQTGATGAFLESFGDEVEDAQSGDVTVSGVDVSTKDAEIMDNYGIIVSQGTDVESQVDNDELTISVPEDQVFAQVTVSMGGEVTTTSSLGNVMIRDSEVANSNAKNLVVVGGSAINTAAATLLGEAYKGEAFTAATGVGPNEFLIKGFANSAIDGKFALLVAGYEAADTNNAVTYLTNKKPDTSKEWKGTTATAQAVEVTSN